MHPNLAYLFCIPKKRKELKNVCSLQKGNQLKDDALPDDFFDMVLSAIDFQVNKKKNKKMRKKLNKICKNAFIPESEKKKTKKKHKK